MTTRWRPLVMVGLLLALALLVVRAQPTRARAALPQARNAPGELDITFGGDGLVTTDWRWYVDQARSVVPQPDGKLIVAGSAQVGDYYELDFALARYNADGSLDTSFGDVLVTTDFAGDTDAARSVVLQPDGKIVVAGYARISDSSKADFALARYHANGSLDPSFGDGDGLVTTDFAGWSDQASSMALQPDGKIVVAGYTVSSLASKADFGLARYNADGSLDTSFGDGDGLVTTDFAGGHDLAHSMALQPDGKIVVVGDIMVKVPDGSGTGGKAYYDFALARYNADGSLDTSFGDGDGLVTTDFGGGNSSAQSVVLQPDGKIVAAGSAAFPGYDFDSVLARYNTDGSLDTSFGGDGLVNSGFVEDDDGGQSVALQPNGKIVVAGHIVGEASGTFYWEVEHDFGLARYNADGSPDTTFGGDGLVNTRFTEDETEVAFSVALQPDGKIIAAGYAAFPGTYNDFAVARYQGDLYLYLPLVAR